MSPVLRVAGECDSVDPADWNGCPLTIYPQSGTATPTSATMKYPPDGSTIFAFENDSKLNSAGKLVLTNGGAPPQTLVSPALLKQPQILVGNWGAAPLTLNNISVNPNTPIWIAAYGPGLGPPPSPLPVGTLTPVRVDHSLQGTTQPTYMQLSFEFANGLALFGIIGGPPDTNGNNAYVIALNSSYGNTGGPPSSKLPPAPPGYYATSAGNTWSMEFNWGTSVVYVGYFGSGSVVPPAQTPGAPFSGEPTLPQVLLTSI